MSSGTIAGGPDPRRAEEAALRAASENARLADAAMALLHCQSEDDVYGVIADFLTELIPRSVVIVNEATPDPGRLVTRRLGGLEQSLLTKAADLLGISIVGNGWGLSAEHRTALTSGALTRVPGGLAELSGGEIPAALVTAATEVFGIHDVFTIGIADQERILGNLAILTRSDDTLLSPHIIESFVRHCFTTLLGIRKAKDAASTAEQNALLLRSMVEGLALHEVITDASGRPCDYRFLEVNPAFENMAGLRAEHIVGRTVLEVLPDIAAEWSAHCTEVALTGAAARFEVHSRAIGRYYGVVVYSPRDGQLVSVVSDITERKHAEASALESRKQFEAMVESLPLAVVLSTGLDEIVEYMNPAFQRLFGYTIADVPAIIHWWPLAYPDEEYRAEVARAWADGVERAQKSGLPFEPFETVVTCRDGSTKIVAWDYVTMGDKNYSLGLDLTERKQAEQALRESERWLSESQRIAQLGHFIYDIAADTWKPSESLYDTLGAQERRATDFEGWLSVVHPDDRERMSRFYRDEVFGHKDDFEAEYRIIRPRDGVERWVRTLGTVERGDDGTAVAMFGIIQDITEQRQAQDALEESRDMLANLTAQVPGVVYQYRLYPDGSSAFPFASPGMNAIYEVTPEEVQRDATPVFGRLHPDDFERVSAEIAESARTLKPFHCEFRVILPEQGLRWRLSDAMPQRTDDGGTLWYGIISDITDRKLLEFELRESESQLKRAQHFARIGSWTWDIKTNELQWSDEMFRLFGLDRASFSGSLPDVISSAIHPDDREKVEAANAAVAEHGRPEPLAYRVVWPDGSVHVVWAEAGEMQTDENGEPAYLSGTVQDITERVGAEEALRQRERHLSAILETTQDGFWLVDTSARIRMVNEAYCTMSGYSQEGLVRRSVADIDALQSRQKIMETIAVVREQGSMLFETVHRRRDGSTFDVEASVTSLGDTGEIVCFFRDISARKRAEVELRLHRDHLEELVTERTAQLTEVNRELREANEAKSRFLANVSHELRTPLNSIIGFSSVLKQGLAGSLTDEQLRHIEMVNGSGQHLLSLINEILDIARIEAGRVEVSIEEFDAAVLIERVAEEMRPLADKQGIELQVANTGVPVPLKSDQPKVKQILLNLVGNAVKMTGEGRITVSLEDMPGARVSITVSDTGPGIPAEELSNIFAPFVQLEAKDAAKPEGTGLGLAVSRELASLLGGTITVVSEVGVGSAFTLTLPSEYSAL